METIKAVKRIEDRNPAYSNRKRGKQVSSFYVKIEMEKNVR